MPWKEKIVIAFDLYGTLLSTESIAKELATHFGQEKAASLAGLWRRYQLEYTWRLNSMSASVCFVSTPLLLAFRLWVPRPISALLRRHSQFPRPRSYRIWTLLG